MIHAGSLAHGHTALSNLVDPGMACGASLLIAEEGRFLLAARPLHHVENRTIVELTGIGGWLEEGETFAEAVAREAVEETGATVRLLDLHQTLVIHSPDRRESLCFVGETGPAALVFRRWGTPAFQPWSEEYESIVAVAVYAGTLNSRPQVVAESEHPFFMWLYPEQMLILADADVPFDYLLADGAEVVGPAGNLSRGMVRLTDSIQALISALGSGAYAFLGEIARLTQPARAE